MNCELLTRLSGAELAEFIVTGELSPVEVTEAYLERIDRLDSQLSAYITVCRDEALRTAREAERAVARGDELGPLHGLPLGVKDQLATRGIKTTVGSKILADNVPDEDATAFLRAKEAGAILIGKLNMTEFAAGLGDRFKYGEPRNPWDLERTVGGSSTGSAIAICASLCAITLGEDTGGSIRMPASFTGIVGVRPTWGLVSRHGVFPVSWSLDTVGPMTRTVEDAALLLNAISGYDPRDPLTSKNPVPDYKETLSSDLRGVRAGVVKELTDEEYTDPEVLRLVREAASKLEELGAVVEDVSLPLVAAAGPVMSVLAASEGSFVVREWLRTRPQDFGPYLRRRWSAGSLIPAQVLHKAARMRAILRREWLRLFKQFDVLLSPATAAPAEKIEYETEIVDRKDTERRSWKRRGTTAAAALAGAPAMTIPCGFSSENLPVGLQIMADRFQEGVMFKVGYAYEQSTMWHKRRPRL